MKEHMEEIKTYMRGHNLFDIFYGRYKKEEKDLLKKYIEIAPRDEFSDILDAADSFKMCIRDRSNTTATGSVTRKK